MLEQDFSYQGNHSQLNPRDTFNPNLEQKHEHFVIHLPQVYPLFILREQFFLRDISHLLGSGKKKGSASIEEEENSWKKEGKRGKGVNFRARGWRAPDGNVLSRRGSGVWDVCSRGIKKSRAFFIAPFKLCNCIPRRATCAFFTALLRADYAEFIVTKADTMQRRLDAR